MTEGRRRIEAEMVAFVQETADRLGLKVGTFGHMGDGNLHPTFLTDETDAAEWGRLPEVAVLPKTTEEVAAVIAARLLSKSPRHAIAAAAALAEQVTDEELDLGMLYPEVSRLREVSKVVAAAVMREASSEGIGDMLDDGEIQRRLDAAVWEPVYREYIPA